MQQMMEEEPMPSEALWSAARVLMTERHYEITPECALDLRALLETGGQQLTRDEQTIASVSGQEAIQNTLRLVSLMIDESESESVSKTVAPERLLHEWTLYRARLKFCPCYPFC
jgi:hypothetical protein